MHILSPETDNCPSWISGRERMTVENISWSISTKECCRPRRGLNPRPPGLQSDGASNWATEAGNRWTLARISTWYWLVWIGMNWQEFTLTDDSRKLSWSWSCENCINLKGRYDDRSSRMYALITMLSAFSEDTEGNGKIKALQVLKGQFDSIVSECRLGEWPWTET